MQRPHQRTHRTGLAGAFALGVALIATGFSPARAATVVSQTGTTDLVGAGSTFVAPFVNAAFATYGRTHPVRVTYRAVGSLGGIVQFMDGTVDFAASDVPLNAARLAQAGGNLAVGGAPVQVPVALGGEAIVYNLPSLAGKTLRLDGPTTARIFLGAIALWDDPALRRLNPTLALPHLAIAPVHRIDGSGTTYIFTDYLNTVSSPWATAVGKGLKVLWPLGLGGLGNGGVADAVVQQPGAIGYVEQSYALSARIPYAQIENRAGVYVSPTSATILAAAARFPHVTAQHYSIVDAPGATSYPIAGYTWVVLRSHLADRVHRRAVGALLRWLVTTGQQDARATHYVPLPPSVQVVAEQALSQIAA